MVKNRGTKQDPYICCLQETNFRTRDTYRLKVKGWKKIFHANVDQKKAGVAILISDKIGFQIKAVKRDKEGHYIMIKGLTSFWCGQSRTLGSLLPSFQGQLQFRGTSRLRVVSHFPGLWVGLPGLTWVMDPSTFPVTLKSGKVVKITE